MIDNLKNEIRARKAVNVGMKKNKECKEVNIKSSLKGEWRVQGDNGVKHDFNTILHQDDLNYKLCSHCKCYEHPSF